jgi:hypothetical protein
MAQRPKMAVHHQDRFWTINCFNDPHWFPTNLDMGPVLAKVISLPFQGVQECHNWMSYATCTSGSIWTDPGWVGFWISNLFWQFWLNPILFGHGTRTIRKLVSSYFRAYVELPNLMLYASCTSIWSRGGPGLRVGLRVKLSNSELD